MPEAARMAAIDKVIADEQKRIKEEEERRQNEFLSNDYLSANTYQNQSNQQDGKWYFYNPSTITLGKAEFERKWGKRKLEDNWRRANKAAAMRDELPEMEPEFGDNAEGTAAKNRDELPGFEAASKKGVHPKLC